jgi:rod shape determining protein RodA
MNYRSKQHFSALSYLLILLLLLVCSIGIFMLYDASNAHLKPWASAQLVHLGIGFALMLLVAFTPLKFWLKYAYILYGLVLLLLILVDVMGHIGMGAQRWLNLYYIKLQPSELMRITLVLALACYFHRQSFDEVNRFSYLLLPLGLIFLPTLFVLRQPDLGTSLLLVMSGAIILFLAGIHIKYFIGTAVLACGAIPALWPFLHAYQKKRVLVFLNPELDPYGAGYHILQSKIALGSGSLWGKGFLKGTQSHLNFLPEKQTDFIFTLYAEEFGFVGALFLLGLFLAILLICIIIALKSHNIFARLVTAGITSTFFLYIFINTAMVMGLVPVVGVPLPLVSYGGTALVTLLIGFGFILNADINRENRLPRYA